MADAGVDIAQLTEEQQLTLQQLIAVTEQEPKDAIPLLQRCQWNLQVTIHQQSFQICFHMLKSA